MVRGFSSALGLATLLTMGAWGADPRIIIADPDSEGTAKWFSSANFSTSLLEMPLTTHKETSGFIANAVNLDEPQLAQAWYLLKLSQAQIEDALGTDGKAITLEGRPFSRNEANAMLEEIRGKIRIVEQIGISRSTILPADSFQESKEKWRQLSSTKVNRGGLPSELDFSVLVKLDKLGTEAKLLKEVALAAGTPKASLAFRSLQDFLGKSGILAEPMKAPPKPVKPPTPPASTVPRPMPKPAPGMGKDCPGKIGDLRDGKLD